MNKNTFNITASPIPAIACSLQGGYLIEASAGTGKTWTLTGILLRLLIEKKYPPERIIATTFTRDAAQEIQERLQGRLQEFYQYLQWLISCRTSYAEWFLVGFSQHLDEVIVQIVKTAKEAGVPSCDDPIYVYLLGRLLSDADTSALDRTMHQVSLLLSMLDKLFVGTLDSLAQKLLREFASELSYHTDTMLISEDEGKQQIRSLIHDKLRQQHNVVYQMPRVAQFLPTSIFSEVDEAFYAVNLSLQFYQADIDEWHVNVADVLAVFDDFIERLLAIDWSVFEPYCDFETAKSLGFSGTLRLAKNFYCLPNIIEKIRQSPTTFYEGLSEIESQWLKECNHDKLAGLFKKGFNHQQTAFFALPIDKIVQLNNWVVQLQQLVQDYISHLYRDIALDVRSQFKQQLEYRKQSTFTFQMVRLNEALANNPSLCRHIRHLYPVALIDESQDINGLQLTLLRHIYLDDMKENWRGFLLFVGDPKQAIYRFRGGDVANYNFVKHYHHHANQPLLNQSLNLIENRRSHQTMINSLNMWFLDNGQPHHQNPAYFGDGIYYQPIKAVNDKLALSWQQDNHKYDYVGNHSVSILHFNHQDKNNVVELVAQHISTLLQHHHLNGEPIKPSDIAILANKNEDLSVIKKALNQIGIPAITAKSINIFNTQSAKDLYVLLSAMIESTPTNIGHLLTGSFFDFSLTEAMEITSKTEQEYINIMTYLKIAKEKWQRYGVMSGLYYALLNNPLKDKINHRDLWQSCAKQGERYLADLWQLLEIVGNQSKYNSHELYLLSWYSDMMHAPSDKDDYKQRPLPSESGINLMTLHKSKGLQFNIVYVFDLDKPLSKKSALFYPYSDDNFVRRISPSNHKKIMATYDDLDFYKKNNDKEQIDERLRLGYVALTRACEQLFVVAIDTDKKYKNLLERPLYLWLDNVDKATLSLPERLKNHVDWIELANSQMLTQQKYQNHSQEEVPIGYQAWDEVFKEIAFYGKHRTSASALMNQLGKSKQLLLENDVHEEEWQLPAPTIDGVMSGVSYLPNDIRRDFERGAYTGQLLHKLLQVINANNTDISMNINQWVKKLGFSPIYIKQDSEENAHHEQLLQWLNVIMDTPLISQTNLRCLLQSPTNQQPTLMREMSFTLGLSSNFSIEKLNQVLKKYSNKYIEVLDDDKFIYDYLNGEIDLVYEHEGKFYVVDYKSNFVSNELSHYQENILDDKMKKAGYWLQACVYQVALHRLLSIRLENYVGNEKQYLGAVEFVFLRGVDNQHRTLGKISWDTPMELILALDELFG